MHSCLSSEFTFTHLCKWGCSCGFAAGTGRKSTQGIICKTIIRRKHFPVELRSYMLSANVFWICSAIFKTVRNVQASAQPFFLHLVHLSRLAPCLRQEISQEVNQGSRCCSWKYSYQSQASTHFSCQIPSTQMSMVSGSHTGVVRGKAWRRMFSTLQLTRRCSARGVILPTYAGMLCITRYCFPARESSCWRWRFVFARAQAVQLASCMLRKGIWLGCFPLTGNTAYRCLHTFMLDKYCNAYPLFLAKTLILQ